MAELIVYAICDNDCKYETYTREQFLAVLEQAIANGTLEGINENLPTVQKVANIRNNEALQFWSGTEAQFNALNMSADDYTNVVFRVSADGKIYICTDDTALETLKKELKDSFKSVLVETTISTWAETMTFSNSAITATSPVEMIPGKNITAEQLEALQAANAVDDGNQAAGKASFKLMGEVPSIAIPVRFIIRRDL